MAGLACSPRDLAPHSRTEIGEALEDAGLRVCDSDQTPSGLSGTDEVVQLDVAVERCGSDVNGNDRGRHVDERRRTRPPRRRPPRRAAPRFADAVWKYGTTMVLIAGVPDDDVVDRVQDAMTTLGVG